jgi:hypothetical protein
MKFSRDVRDNVSYRVEVLRNHLIVLDGDGKTILEENDQLDGASRIDHSPKQRGVVTQCLRATKEEVSYKKTSDFRLDVVCMQCRLALLLIYEL